MTDREAKEYRRKIELSAQTMTDSDALAAMMLYPSYDKLTKERKNVKRGFRFRYGDKLYRVEQPEYTFDGTYAPGVGTESLYSRVALPSEGTQDNPIPYSGNMALENGKYYVQDGVVYLCTRDTGVPVYNALADLVGLYVAVNYDSNE